MLRSRGRQADRGNGPSFYLRWRTWHVTPSLHPWQPTHGHQRSEYGPRQRKPSALQCIASLATSTQCQFTTASRIESRQCNALRCEPCAMHVGHLVTSGCYVGCRCGLPRQVRRPPHWCRYPRVYQWKSCSSLRTRRDSEQAINVSAAASNMTQGTQGLAVHALTRNTPGRNARGRVQLGKGSPRGSVCNLEA